MAREVVVCQAVEARHGWLAGKLGRKSDLWPRQKKKPVQGLLEGWSLRWLAGEVEAMRGGSGRGRGEGE
eukprot:785785-Pelagomonas_calceolata.AAC.1